MLFQIKSYLHFLWNSKNEHGVHSPFVFSLVTKCFYDKKNKPEYAIIKDYRKALLKNKNTINVTDFGAGSRVFKSNTRQIAQIAKTAGISSKRAKLLFRITQYFQPKSILEIGTSLGLATSALALGNTKAKLTTLEGCPETSKIAKEQLQKSNFKNVTTITT
ncbi:MAG: class I SAM-dependent methyltransferase, partial [Flavobacterium sp.]